MADSQIQISVKAVKRHVVKSSHPKKPFFHFWFKFLLLLCLVAFILCYTLSGSSTSHLLYKHYQRFFRENKKVNLYPPYKVHPQHRGKLYEIQETTPKKVQETTPKKVQETTPKKLQETTPKKLQETTPKKVQETTPKKVQETTPKKLQETTLPSTVLPPLATTVIQDHQAYAPNYHFIMDHTEVCKTENPFLVLMVPVAPNNVAARDAIRQTWGNHSLVQGKKVLTLFMLGLPGGADVQQQQEKLDQENLQHHDLIQSNFMDTYLNLTIKTMVIMHWLATHCPTAAYAMKIDSDMFLNIDNLLIMLQKPGIPKTNYLTGMLMWNRPVVRSKNSKWYVSEEMYPDSHYPTYTLGMGYVFSNDLPEKYVAISKSIKPFNIEDAYIGMCMKKLGLSVTSPPDPGQFRAYSGKYNRCEYSKVITYILGSARQLVEYWRDLKKPGPPC